MRTALLTLVILFSPLTVMAQLKPLVEDQGTFGLHVVDDSIVQHMKQDGVYAEMFKTQVGMYWPTAP